MAEGEPSSAWNFTQSTAVVRTEDGKLFSVNSFDLSLQSHFFRALFHGPFGRSPDQVFSLKSVSSDAFECCLQLLSNDDLGISEMDLALAIKVLNASSFLALQCLEQRIINIICSHVNEDNLVEMYNWAKVAHSSLAGRLWDMILRNFEKLFGNRSFVRLSGEDMEVALADETLNVLPNHEQRVLDDWCLEHQEGPEAEALRASMTGFSSRNLFSSGFPVFAGRLPRSLVVVVGGWGTEGVTNSVDVFSERCHSWKSAKTNVLPPALAYHGLVSRPEGIYTFGGFDGRRYFNDTRYFNYETGKWQALGLMKSPRSYVSGCGLGKHFFAIGGFNGVERLRTAEVFDVERQEWTLLPGMQCSRSDGSSVVIENRVYAVGGFDGQHIHDTVEVFDPVNSNWTLLRRSMMIPRTGVSALPIAERVIGVFGGFNGTKRLRTCELYDTREGHWHQIGNMITTRSNFSVEVLAENSLLAVGGYDGSRTTALVESFDLRANLWRGQPPLQTTKSALKAVHIDDLHAIRAFVDPL